MRKLIAGIVVAGATALAGQAIAADIPFYPPYVPPPPVDEGLEGSFYLRGSGAWNGFHTKTIHDTYPVETSGFGYSLGAGIGFETGTGLRIDGTIDFLGNSGLSIEKDDNLDPDLNGTYTLNLRSTVALVNAYYDFALGGHGGYSSGYGYSAAGGAFGYVGVGVGVAFNHTSVDSPDDNIPDGSNTSFAAAGMVGVGYDFGAFTADVGYRGLYIASINNGISDPDDGGFSISNALIHEVRGTLRYRFN